MWPDFTPHLSKQEVAFCHRRLYLTVIGVRFAHNSSPPMSPFPALKFIPPRTRWQVLAPGLFSPFLSSTPRMLTSQQTLHCSSLSAGSPLPHPDPSLPNQSNPSKTKKLHSHPPLLHFHPVTPSGLLSTSLGPQVPWHPITVMVSGTLQKY